MSVTVSGIELTGDEKLTEDGVLVKRIRATKDMPWHGVKAGDVGGWVEQLDQINDWAWVGDEACISDWAGIEGEALIYGSAHIFGSARVGFKAKIGGDAQVEDDAMVNYPGDVLALSIGSDCFSPVTLFRTKYGHRVYFEERSRTLDELAEIAEANDWQWGIVDETDVNRARHELEALIQQMREHMAQW